MVPCIRSSPPIYVVIQGNSADALFQIDGLLAELPAILDSFFHQYHNLLHRGGWSGVVESHKVPGKAQAV